MADQVSIKYGPAKYDSPKAVRRAIEEAATETEQNTINNIVNNPDIDLGGGASSDEIAEVVDYDPSSHFADVTLPSGESVSAKNVSGDYLSPGDQVIVGSLADGTYVVTGIYQYASSISPTNIPIPVVPGNFPIDVKTQPNPILMEALGNGKNRLVTDVTGNFSGYPNSTYGWNVAYNGFGYTDGSINGIDPSTMSSISVGPTGDNFADAVTNNIWVQPNGRMFLSGSSLSVPGYKNTAAGTFTLLSGVALGGAGVFAYDDVSGAVWAMSSSQSNWIGWLDSDPALSPSLSVTRTGGGSLVAGNGFLCQYSSTFVRVKTANDSSAFVTQHATLGPTSTMVSVGPTGALYATRTISGFLYIDVYFGGTRTSYNTGISMPTPRSQVNAIGVSASGNVLISAAVRGDVIGLLSTSWYQAVFVTTLAATSLLYFDTDLNALDTQSPTFGGTNMNQVSPGVFRFLQTMGITGPLYYNTLHEVAGI